MPSHARRLGATSLVIETPREADATPLAETSLTPHQSPHLRWIGPIVAVMACGAILVLLAQLLSGLDVSVVAASALATPPLLIVASLLFSSLSYAALIGYDALGVRAASGKTIPLRTIAVGSFTSYAIGHALGFPLLTAGWVRWRVYGAAGLSLGEVAKLTAVAAMTLWIGMAAALGLGASLGSSQNLPGILR